MRKQKQIYWYRKNRFEYGEGTHSMKNKNNITLFNLILNHQIVSKNDIFILIKEIIDFYKITKCLD